MKKQLLLLGLGLGLSLHLFSQTTADVTKIMNASIVEESLLNDIQQNTNQTFTLESNLFDLSNFQTTFPAPLNISPVFKAKGDVANDYYEWILDFSSEKEIIVIVIKHKANLSWTFSLEKLADKWVVQEKLQN